MRTLQIQQAATLDVAHQLIQLDFRLARIAEAIHLPADVDEIFENRHPETPASRLYTAIGAAKVELSVIVRVLLGATQATEVTLRQEYRKMQTPQEDS